MARKFSILAAAASGVLLSACGITFDYESLRRHEMAGAGFETALASEYRRLALFEADEMFDWPDAARYGQKALDAAAGRSVAPDRVAARRISGPVVGTMASAYADLHGYLRSDATRRLPALMARAQAHFDCWLEQREEGWQRQDIAHCRDAFRAAMLALEGQSTIGFAPYPATAVRPVRGVAATPGRNPAPQALTLFFDFDSAALGDESHKIIRHIADTVRPGGEVTLLLDGHADRAGPVPYNHRLSMRRAEVVREALLAAGVEARLIQSRAYGERRPRVQTPDGLADARNRRVEIIIGPAAAL